MKKLFGLFALILMIPSAVLAADFRQERLGKDETVRNLYISGNNVSVDGTVEKDLVVAGNNVWVGTNIGDDIMAAGANVTINGNAGGSSRIAGGTVNIRGDVTEDLVVAGGTVNIENDTQIGNDLIVTGGTVNINGTVNGSVRLTGGDVNIAGKVNGNVFAENVGSLTVADGAVIGGTLNYSSPRQANIEGGAQIGNIEYRQTQDKKDGVKALTTGVGAFIVSILGSLMTLFVIVYLLPRFAANYTAIGLGANWPLNFLIGFAAIIAIPIMAILLFVTILGIQLGIVLLLLYALLLAIASPLNALLLGSLIVRYFEKNGGYPVDWRAIVIGIIVLSLLYLIPVIGWLAVFVLYLLSFGTLVRMWYLVLRGQRETL